MQKITSPFPPLPPSPKKNDVGHTSHHGSRGLLFEHPAMDFSNVAEISIESAWGAKNTAPSEPCSKPFLDLNAISRPYACTLRNPYATTIGAYAEDYGQHNLTHCLRDPGS